jgi:hypothetical protein
MFSGLFENTAISLGAGIAVGLADSVGFFYTAQMFLFNATTKKRIIAAILEAARLFFLFAVIILLYRYKTVSIILLLASAIFVSLGGKLFFIFKRLKA